MIRSAVLRGLDVFPVEIEVGLNRTRDSFCIFGLGRKEVQESRHRLQNALQASGYHWPEGAITINLDPADVPKSGTSLDWVGSHKQEALWGSARGLSYSICV